MQVREGAACGNRTHDLRITRAPDSADSGRYLRLCCRRLLLRRLWRHLRTVVRVTTRVTSVYRRVVVQLGEAMSNHWRESWHSPGYAWPVVDSWLDSP